VAGTLELVWARYSRLHCNLVCVVSRSVAFCDGVAVWAPILKSPTTFSEAPEQRLMLWGACLMIRSSLCTSCWYNCLSVRPSIRPYVHPFINQSIHLSVRPPVCLYIHPSAIHSSIYLSICLSVCLSVCPSVRLSVCLIYLSVNPCLSTYLPVYNIHLHFCLFLSVLLFSLHRPHVTCYVVYTRGNFGVAGCLYDKSPFDSEASALVNSLLASTSHSSTSRHALLHESVDFKM
jgi:hypothetical protein